MALLILMELLDIPRVMVEETAIYSTGSGDDVTRPIKQLGGQARGPQKLRAPISGLIGDVRIPVKPLEEGGAEFATYTPSSIICHYGGESANSGHYATYRREGENGFILNDSEVERVANLEEPSGYKFKELGIDDPGEEMMNHREFLECNAYIVSYRCVE